MPIQKLSVENNVWTKKKDIQKKLRDFPNITMAGLESAIVAKRYLKNNNNNEKTRLA